MTRDVEGDRHHAGTVLLVLGVFVLPLRVRTNVESLPPARDAAPITISIGGAIFPNDGATVAALFQTADERLCAAKREGRNRVVVGSYAVAAR